MGYLKRNRSMVLVILGTLLMATSIFWEYVRMRPDYLRIVSPWSQRGYDITQGYVIAAIALFVLLLAVLLTTHVIREGIVWSVAVTAVTTAAAVALTVITDAGTLIPAWPLTWGLALLAALAALAATTLALPEEMPRLARRGTKVAVFFAAFFGGGFAFTSLFSGNETQMWLIVLIGFLLMSALVILRTPSQLAGYRLLMNVHVVGWLIAITSPAAVRKTLQGLQDMLSEGTAVAELKDIQITSGMLIAVFGGLLAFAGTVALWANRRDHITAEVRSRQQLEAARKSAEELGSAL